MVLSKSILVNGLVGLGTVVGATTLGVVYRNEIGGLFTKKESGEGEADSVVVGGAAGASNDKGVQGGETTPEAAVAGAKGSEVVVKKEVTVEEINKEAKNLNIEGCELEDQGAEKSCGNIDSSKLSKLKFFMGEEEVENLVVQGMDEGVSLAIKMKRANDRDIFPSGSKYTFETNGNIIIKKSENDESNQMVLYSGTNPEFTVENGKLVRAWNAEKLGKKVWLTCVKKEKETETNECSFEKQIKVIKDGKSQSLNVLKVEDKKITFVGETSNFNQGFKFVVPEGGIKGTDETVVIEAGDYEIKYVDGKEGERGWGLSKITQNNN